MAKKILKVSAEHIYENESWFKEVDFSDPDETALAFGCWLNLYFEPWAPNHSTWIDMDKHAYTTEELYNEFIKEYKS